MNAPSGPDEAGGPSGASTPAEPLIRICPYCRESVHARAERCRYCHSYLSVIGRQRAAQEWFASVGLPNVDVSRPGCFGLSIPGVAVLAVAVYFGAQGVFSLVASQPAMLQAACGIVGALLALTFLRVRR